MAGNWLVDKQGYLQKDVSATSLDETMTINIPKDTKILDSADNPLANISVTPIAPPAAAPDGYQILKTFDFTPNGATFDSGITIAIAFNPSEVPVAKTVVIAFYNVATGKWEFIPSTINADNAATFTVTHFSAYSLMYNSTEKSSATSIWIWVGLAAMSLVALAMLTWLAVLLRRRRA